MSTLKSVQQFFLDACWSLCFGPPYFKSVRSEAVQDLESGLVLAAQKDLQSSPETIRAADVDRFG